VDALLEIGLLRFLLINLSTIDAEEYRRTRDVGHCTGTKKECLNHIEEVWTDMRPLSWRKHWGENEGR